VSEAPRDIGVIADTHGLLRPEAVRLLRGSQLIIHAGDVGDPHILDELRRLAPVAAVRGNVDGGDWAKALPMTEDLMIGARHLHVLHILADLAVAPEAAGIAAVIFGHSHKPEISYSEGVLYFNPGSAGPRRFKLPVTLGRLLLTDDHLRPEIIEIDC
jgi:putative phosphoesterase